MAKFGEIESLAKETGHVYRRGDGEWIVSAGPATVHWGYLSGAESPILTVPSGTSLTIDTVPHEGLLPDQGEPAAFFARFGIARPQVLAVEILDVQPRVPYGVNSMRMGKGVLPEEFTTNRSIVIPFDLERGVALFRPDISIPLRPFFGILATAPPLSLGRANSVPPGPFGGNLDIKHLVAGTTIGLHERLDDALRIAVSETIRFLEESYGLSRADAYAFASVGVDCGSLKP